MKKFIALCLCLILFSLCFVGCRYNLSTTEEYKLYDRFVRSHDAGMTKQEVFDKIGCPGSYYDKRTDQGENIHYSSVGKEKFAANLATDTSTMWVYYVYKSYDPPYPYRLVIQFDSQGKTISAEMILTPGG